jgi:hypothetical protein
MNQKKREQIRECKKKSNIKYRSTEMQQNQKNQIRVSSGREIEGGHYSTGTAGN